jgi:hypothetical protein
MVTFWALNFNMENILKELQTINEDADPLDISKLLAQIDAAEKVLDAMNSKADDLIARLD